MLYIVDEMLAGGDFVVKCTNGDSFFKDGTPYLEGDTVPMKAF